MLRIHKVTQRDNNKIWHPARTPVRRGFLALKAKNNLVSLPWTFLVMKRRFYPVGKKRPR